MEKVVLAGCRSYEADEVQHAIEFAFEHLGGIDKFVKPGMKVLIKPNLLIKKKPEEAATTHPAVVEAIAKKVIEAGAEVTIADSPGGFYNESFLKSIYTGCGYKDIPARTGAKLNYDVSAFEEPFAKGKVARKFTFIDPMRKADIIINVPKLKTHGMMVYTGAVKNLFGLIPGVLKAEYHLKLSNKKDFADLLIDICECVKPTISIMDAVDAMEGNGPSAGSPRHVGLLLASTNPYALDVTVTNLIGIDSKRVFTIVSASERGLTSRMDQIEIVNGSLEEYRVKDFKLPEIYKDIGFFKGKVYDSLLKYLRPKPVFLPDKCTKCRECAKHCPPEVINFDSGKPVVDLNKCIRCFCCQELCPNKAVEIRKPWILRRITRTRSEK